MSHRRQQVFLIVGLVVLAFNLRPVAVSVGPVLNEIRRGLAMGPATAGVLTTMPVLCFAAFGYVAPALARILGIHRAILTALVLTTVALGVRAEAGSWPLFLGMTVPALAGMATANVLLPSLVKEHFADRVGLVTGIYTTALAVGLTGASVLTVPAADLTGSWRGGLAVWAVTAFVAALPWLGLIGHDVKPDAVRHGTIPTRQVVRSPLAWTMAVFFGAQSLQAYSVFGWLPQIFRDAGFSANTAGLLLGTATATSIPISFLLPRLAGRLTNQAPLVLCLCAAYVVGYVGLLVAPMQGAWLWALCLGVGTGIFPLLLTLIGLRARTSDGTAALSGFAQSVGYLISAVGPFMVGALYGATGGWTVPLIVLALLVVPQTMSGLLVSRPRFLEDEIEVRLPSAPPASPGR